MTLFRRLDLTAEHDFGDDEPAIGTGALSGFQTRGLGQSGDVARESGDGTRFYGQLGLAVRPVIAAGLEMLSLLDEKRDEYVGIALLQRHTTHETAVASGETRVYATGAPKVCVRLLGGLIEIRVESGGVIKVGADEGEVQLAPGGGGTYAGESVARNTDLVNASAALTAWFTSATTKLNALPGAATPVAPITLGAIVGSTSRAKA